MCSHSYLMYRREEVETTRRDNSSEACRHPKHLTWDDPQSTLARISENRLHTMRLRSV
jgi:hypothetical protein